MLKEGKLNMFAEAQNISIWGHKFTKEEFDKLVEMHRTPTWEEVVKAWQDTIDDKIQIQRNDEGIRIQYPNGIYYLINLEQVYSNRKVFSMNVNATLYAINLTIRYLEAQEINNGTI